LFANDEIEIKHDQLNLIEKLERFCRNKTVVSKNEGTPVVEEGFSENETNF